MSEQRDVQIRLTPQKAADDSAIRRALGIGSAQEYRIVRKSIDARRADVYVDLCCQVNPQAPRFTERTFPDVGESSRQVIVVGSGPAGLFAALELLEKGIRPIVVERGKDVHSRKVDIARISTMSVVDPESNYSFGEGGAGTYSDGKLFTRSKKRGENSKVLETFVQFGADESILYEAHPHIGTDRLPSIIERMRGCVVSHGGLFLFGTRVTELLVEDGKAVGCVACESATGKTMELRAEAVILAIGNAARDTFAMLQSKNIAMEAKSLAVGVRLEHPQELIDSIQYHNPKGRGDYLPAAEYSFAAQVDGVGVYSFCMCPGGFVVPAMSDDGQVVVNGMSPSNRGSRWANSGMVVEYRTSFLQDGDALAMMRFQQKLEHDTFLAAGRGTKAPAQRMCDFLSGKVSADLPRSSYSPGLVSCDMKSFLPKVVSTSLDGGLRVFGRQARGFETNEALLIGSETRTSSPVRIVRDDESLESVNCRGLYPCGEGAGYAGGIVSAAVDGIRCAIKIFEKG